MIDLQTVHIAAVEEADFKWSGQSMANITTVRPFNNNGCYAAYKTQKCRESGQAMA